MSNPEEAEVTAASETSLNRSHASLQLNRSEILDAPLASRDLLDLHLRYLGQYGDEIANSARDRQVFKDVSKGKPLDEILHICRKVHDIYENELPELLRTLSHPLDQLDNPNTLPEVIITILKDILGELRQVDQSAGELIGELNDLLYKKNLSETLLSDFFTSIEKPVLTAIIKYWSRSCRDIIARCTEQIAVRDYRSPENNPPPAHNSPPVIVSSSNPQLVTSPPLSSTPFRPVPDLPNNRRLGIDLAKAKLPRFLGKKEEFSMFFALLNEILDYNRDYPETTRIAFLVSNLGGEPLNSVQSIPIREGSLALMLKSLQDRYGDSEDQVDRLIKVLKDKRLSIPRDHKELTSWYYQLRDMSVSILSSASEAQERLFLSCLFDSLPFKIHESIIASFDRTSLTPTVENVINELGIIIRTREKLQFRALDASDRRETRAFLNSTNANSRSFLPPQNGRTRDSCVFCSRNHPSEDCRTVAEVSSRQRTIRQKGLCFQCLRAGHGENACRAAPCSTCQGKHHVSVCYQRNRGLNQNHSFGNHPPNNRFHQNQSSPSNRQNNKPSFPSNVKNPAQVHFPPLQTPPAQNSATPDLQIRGAILDQHENLMSPKVFLDKYSRPIRAFIDTGSDATFVESSLCSEIGFSLGPVIPRTVVPVGGVKMTIETRETTLPLKSKNGSIVEIRALAVHDLHQFFTGSPVPPEKSPILLVFGQDSFSELEIEKSNRFSPEGFRIMISRFGEFAVTQNFLKTPETPSLALRRARVAELNHLEKIVDLTGSELVERERANECFLGASEGIHETDRNVMKQVISSMVLKENRYWVKLPWLESGPLPESFDRARLRLRSLAGRLSLPDFERYKEAILELMRLNFVEFLPQWSVRDNPRCYYLAHHAVFKMSDTGNYKMRIVYDGSAHNFDEPSLNDLLFRGPVLLPALQAVLTRFFFAPIAVIGDIEKAFMQVGILEEDRDSLRILFGESRHAIMTNEFWVLRFKRLPFGLKCAPAILAIVIDEHLRRSKHPLSSEIGQNLYVDNILLSADSDEIAVQKALASHDLFKKAGMNLRDFASNSGAVGQNLPSNLLNPSPTLKVLGLYWTPSSDVVHIRVPKWNGQKLGELEFQSLSAQLFDPLGLLRPVSIKGHLVLQRYRTLGDSEQSSQSFQGFERFASQFDGRNLEVIRFGPRIQGEYRIHIFCDASLNAAGAVAYVQDCKTLQSYPVLSKAKLTPSPIRSQPKQSPIPTDDTVTMTVNVLEILGLEFGTKIAEFLRAETPFPAKSIHVWTDSTCALSWISGSLPPRNKVFVSNRVKSIKSVSNLQFHHISGSQNPADILSRGADLDTLIGCDLWWKGPPILLQPDTWPTPISFSQSPPTSESLKVCRNQSEPKVVVPLSPEQRIDLLEKSPSFLATVRSLQKLLKCSFSTAQDFLFMIDQTLESPSPREFEQFALSTYRGIWYVTGRLENSDLPDDEKHPIFLSKSSRILPKIVFDLHSRVHPNITTTFAQIRRFIFVPGGKKYLKSVIQRVCGPCRRSFARPYSLPPIPAFPSARVTRQKPFTSVGLDCCGPFSTLNDNRLGKVYLLVITCLTTRYTHVESVAKGDTKSMVLAFRRFIAQFGAPAEILSDNGRNFILGSKVLRRVSQAFRSLLPLSWKFTTPYSPWKGGVYERLIRILKESLRKSLPQRPLAQDLFHTLVVEISSLLNSRPILSSLSVNSSNVVLRPLDLVFPDKRDPFPVLYDAEVERDPDYVPHSDRVDNLVGDWNRSLSRLDRFWKTFQGSYLRVLQSMGKPRSGHYRLPEVGQIVLLVSPNEKNRNCWKTGVVTRLNFGSDDICRSVELECNHKTITRPLSLLAPLEIESRKTSNSVADEQPKPRRTRGTRDLDSLVVRGIYSWRRSYSSPSTISVSPLRRHRKRPHSVHPRSAPRYRRLLGGRTVRSSSIRIAETHRTSRAIRRAHPRGLEPPSSALGSITGSSEKSPSCPSTTNPPTIPIRKLLHSVCTTAKSPSDFAMEPPNRSVPNSSPRHTSDHPAKSTSSGPSSDVESTISEPIPAARSLNFMEKPAKVEWGMLALSPNLHKLATIKDTDQIIL